mgnify:FL=1
MDIAAFSAATQVQSGQRTQQAGIANLKSAQLQAQSLVALLTKATTEAAQTQQAAAAVGDSAPTQEQTSGRPPQRGSIVNILA